MVQPGDVVVVDLFGKVEGGTIVGDNLFYYLANAAKAAGLVVDGSIRDLEGIAEIDMPAYFRKTHPSAIANVMLTGINVPVRIGGVTVMPGDLVLGDPEGVYFIPPQLVKQAVDNADIVHIHDEWTKKMFATGKYKSSEIYGSPKDPELKKQYEEYLKKRLAEIGRVSRVACSMDSPMRQLGASSGRERPQADAWGWDLKSDCFDSQGRLQGF